MRSISVHSGALVVREVAELEVPRVTPAVWADVFTPQAVHELLFDPTQAGPPLFLSTLVARHVAGQRPIVWADASSTFYPPASGLGMDRLYLLRASKNDLPWSAIECLRCRQIGAVIVVLTTRPTRVEVRRLQLAAEHGGGVGILLRPNQVRAGSQIYAAASRWLVSPAPSEASSDPSGKAPPQRWRIERIHGHGRHFAESFIVEKPRALG